MTQTEPKKRRKNEKEGLTNYQSWELCQSVHCSAQLRQSVCLYWMDRGLCFCIQGRESGCCIFREEERGGVCYSIAIAIAKYRFFFLVLIKEAVLSKGITVI